VPIITSTMLYHDPTSFVVFTTTPPRPEPASAPSPAVAVAAVVAAGLAPRLLEALLGASRRPR
jgi:hypothetical protein